MKNQAMAGLTMTYCNVEDGQGQLCISAVGKCVTQDFLHVSVFDGGEIQPSPVGMEVISPPQA